MVKMGETFPAFEKAESKKGAFGTASMFQWIWKAEKTTETESPAGVQKSGSRTWRLEGRMAKRR